MNERLVVCIRDQAAAHFHQFEPARKEIRLFYDRPEQLAWRVAEIDEAVGKINGGLLTSSREDGALIHLEALSNTIGRGNCLPTLVEHFGRFIEGEEKTGELIKSAYVEMKQEIASGTLVLPQADAQPGKLASRLLIRGYGILMEKYFGKPGLRETFVLALEEMLIMRMPESRLFEDLLGQMLGHKELFSTRVQQELNSYDP